jgi:hypothetical protein
MTNSPTFVAHFADGEVTRMTTYCLPGKLDLERAVKLARHAYRSRKQHEPPPISRASFERNGGEVLVEYRAEQIAEAAQ